MTNDSFNKKFYNGFPPNYFNVPNKYDYGLTRSFKNNPFNTTLSPPNNNINYINNKGQYQNYNLNLPKINTNNKVDSSDDEFNLFILKNKVKNLENKTIKLESINEVFLNILKSNNNNNNNKNNNYEKDFDEFKNEIRDIIYKNNQDNFIENLKKNHYRKYSNQESYNINFMAPNVSNMKNNYYDNYNNYNNENYEDKNQEKYLMKSKSFSLRDNESLNNKKIQNVNEDNYYDKGIKEILFHQLLNERENNQQFKEEINDVKSEINNQLDKIEKAQKLQSNSLNLLLKNYSHQNLSSKNKKKNNNYFNNILNDLDD